MTDLSRSLWAGLCVVPAFLVFGCSPPPPSEEAVLYYLRGARIHGGVRRAWPEGQAYVDRVLKADAKLQKELGLLREVVTPLSVWDRGDPRWQDKAAVTAQVAELTGLQQEHGVLRAQALQELADAINKVPKDLPLKPPGNTATFIEAAWKALAIDEVPLREYVSRLESLVAMRLAPYQAVLAAADQWDASRTGLKFKDAARQAQVDAQFAAFQKAVAGRQPAFIALAERRLAEIADRLKVVSREGARWEYDALGDERNYWRHELEAISKEMLGDVKDAEKALKAAEKELSRADAKGKSKLESRVAFGKGQLDRCREEYDQVKARVVKIIEEDKARVAAAAAAKNSSP